MFISITQGKVKNLHFADYRAHEILISGITVVEGHFGVSLFDQKLLAQFKRTVQAKL